MKDPTSKILGIGFPKTGTRSLCKALRVLGYKTIHYPKPLGAILGFQAAADISVAVNWEFLDHLYPGSKFILTLRDSKSWHRSAGRHFAKHADNPYRKCLFGCYTYNKRKFQEAYDNHWRKVRKHFEDRPNDLLVINIIAGDGWEKLCAFLSKPIPSQEFPWRGRKF